MCCKKLFLHEILAALRFYPRIMCFSKSYRGIALRCYLRVMCVAKKDIRGVWAYEAPAAFKCYFRVCFEKCSLTVMFWHGKIAATVGLLEFYALKVLCLCLCELLGCCLMKQSMGTTFAKSYDTALKDTSFVRHKLAATTFNTASLSQFGFASAVVFFHPVLLEPKGGRPQIC